MSWLQPIWYGFLLLPLCVFVFKSNGSDLSFPVHKFWKWNMQWNVLLCKGNLFHISIQRENKQLLLVIKSSRGCTFIIPHLSVHKRNDNVACLPAFLKKTFSIILSEFSIKTNEFVWLLMWYFLWKINSREK